MGAARFWAKLCFSGELSCNGALDFDRENPEVFGKACKQVPLSIVCRGVPDRRALGCEYAKFFQMGLHLLHV